MDGSRFNSLTFLLILLLLLSVSEARPLVSPSMAEKEGSGMFRIRTLKSSGPSPGGGGHRVKKVQSFEGIKDSGPSQGGGHRLSTAREVGAVKHSGPNPGQGHRLATSGHN